MQTLNDLCRVHHASTCFKHMTLRKVGFQVQKVGNVLMAVHFCAEWDNYLSTPTLQVLGIYLLVSTGLKESTGM